MVRIFFLAAGLSCLPACTSGPFDGAAAPSWSPSGPAERAFRFDWRLSGDPAVAPMQVFDDGKNVWLQFTSGQALPAIFGVLGNGEQALPYARRDPYVVVSGPWQALRFRGGRLTAQAARDGREQDGAEWNRAEDGAEPTMLSAQPEAVAVAAASAATLAPQPGVGQLAAGGPLQQGGKRGVFPAAAATAIANAAASGLGLGHGAAPVAARAEVAASTAASPPLIAAQASSVIPAAVRYRAAPPDTTLRGVLARWADSSGWTFSPQHWAVDVDIPLSAAADFSGDFKSAVRQLLSATELADKPLQPCFYGNQVLRVVPLAQPCSRAASAHGGGA